MPAPRLGAVLEVVTADSPIPASPIVGRLAASEAEICWHCGVQGDRGGWRVRLPPAWPCRSTHTIMAHSGHSSRFGQAVAATLCRPEQGDVGEAPGRSFEATSRRTAQIAIISQAAMRTTYPPTCRAFTLNSCVMLLGRSRDRPHEHPPEDGLQ